MNTNQNKTKIVFSMKIAAQLIRKGHKVMAEIPNPANKKYMSWIFAVDETFERDFQELVRKE